MKPKFFIVTTVPRSLSFFNGQYELLAEDFDVEVISSEKIQLEQFGQQKGIKVYYIPMEREISLWTDFKGLLKFICYFRKEKPQIVHGNTPKGSLLSMLGAWITSVPVRIYMCHGLRYQGCSGSKRKLLMWMERISCYCATHIICVSKGVAEILKEDNITKKEPIVIWNGSVRGIDVVKFDPSREFNKETIRNLYGIKKEDFLLTFVGRIVKDKGINELATAFSELEKKYPDMKLLLVGGAEDAGNPISSEAREIIEKNPNIVAPGVQYNIPEILSITDLFVFPSYREGFGLSLMEAGAMGVPSISTDIVGCSEVVINGKTGLLISPKSSEAIKNAIEKLYLDKQMLAFMKDNCRSSIVGRYESSRLYQEYRKYYKSLISNL